MRDTRCPECGLKSFYFKTTTKEFVCKKCGTTWTKEDAESAARHIPSAPDIATLASQKESGGRQITYVDMMNWVDQVE
jgi:transposase-like protein